MSNANLMRVPGERGFTYAEVLLSVVLLAVLLVPALQALQTGISANASGLAARQLRLQSLMEEVLARPFGRLYAETYAVGGNTTTSVSAALSDAGGTPNRRLVVLYRYNAIDKAQSDSDTGLVYVSVYYETDGGAGALDALKGRWW